MKETIHTEEHNGYQAEFVESNGRFSFTIHHPSGRRQCMYCGGSWLESKERAIEAFKYMAQNEGKMPNWMPSRRKARPIPRPMSRLIKRRRNVTPKHPNKPENTKNPPKN